MAKPRVTGSTRVTENQLKADFVLFMVYMFKAMGIGKPTRMQRLFADMLQKPVAKKTIYLAYRGFAKTTIADLFLLWELWKDPTLQQAVWGQNESFACDSVAQILRWVQTYGIFASIAPTNKDQANAHGFDTPQKPLHVRGNSINALSMGGAITGSRADHLLMDDPETSQNGYTQQKRENLDRNAKEASYVIKQGTGRITVLGTIHFDRSLHLRLSREGYRVFIFPMSVPPKEVADLCWQHYPKQIREWINELPEGAPLDRFTEEEIQERMATGRVYYERQCLCNMYRSSSTDRPLDLSRVMVFDANRTRLPVSFEHAREPKYVAEDVMSFMCGDLGTKLYRPFRFAEVTKRYDEKIVYVDPAGEGRDELVYCGAGSSSGYLVLDKIVGKRGGMTPETVDEIINYAIEYGASEIVVESNLNQAAQWIRARMDEQFLVRFGREHLPMVVPLHNQISKGLRLQQLDGIINRGVCIFTPDALSNDYMSAYDSGVESFMDFTLTSQLSNFSANDPAALPFDDRIDAFAGVCRRLERWLGSTPIRQESDAEYERIKELLDAPIAIGTTEVTSTVSNPDVQRTGRQWRYNRRNGTRG